MAMILSYLAPPTFSNTQEKHYESSNPKNQKSIASYFSDQILLLVMDFFPQ